jgi:hypothetical protein
MPRPRYLASHPARLLLICCVTLVFAVSCSSEGSAGAAEAQRVREAVSSFLQEAYRPGGDLDFAYSLLATETRKTCAKSDFTAIVMAARQANGDRSLQTDRFSDIRIEGGRATLKVDSDYDGTPRYFPMDAAAVKEDGEWRYLVTTDPSCKSVAEFFQHEATRD